MSDRARAILRASLAAAVALLAATVPTSSESGSEAHAIYQTEVIPLSDVARHHCHDVQYPLIRCFDTAEERDNDMQTEAEGATSVSSSADDEVTQMTVLLYVTFWEHADYGGVSFTASQPIDHLGDYGWNDAITSFKSLNGQRPKWWEDAYYGLPAWQWAAGRWVRNVGSGANDTFSSVKNVP